MRTRIKKRQQGKGFPIGLITSAAAPLLGEIAKSIFKTIFGRGRRKRRWDRKYCCNNRCSKKSYITKRTNLLRKVQKNEQTKFTEEHYDKNWTKTATD